MVSKKYVNQIDRSEKNPANSLGTLQKGWLQAKYHSKYTLIVLLLINGIFGYE
jgi:hypothetical protein